MKKTNGSEQQFQKNFLWNLVGTTVNALTSFVYMVVVTRINGLEEAGVFSFAFSNACVLVVIGMYMGRTYQISDIKHSNKVFIRSRKITCGFMFLVAIFMAVFYQYTSDRLFIFILWVIFKMLDAYSDVLYAIMQKNEHLDFVGKSLTLKAILSVTVFTVLDYIFRNVTIASLGVVIASLLVVMGYDLRHYGREQVKKEKDNRKDCIFILKDGFFVFGTTLLTTYLVSASKYAINSSGTDTEQAVYGILIMPATAMILIGQYLIQPFLLQMKTLYIQKNANRLRKLIVLICSVLIIVGIAGVVCAGIIGIPALELVYSVGLDEYRRELMIVMFGATSYGCIIIFTNMLTVMHKNKIQFVYFTVISTIVMMASGMMVRIGGVMGATVIYSGSMFVSAIVLGIITNQKIIEESCV